MITAVAETIRAIAVGGEAFSRTFLRRNGPNGLRKLYAATSGVVAPFMLAGIIFSATFEPELRPLVRDLVVQARLGSVALGAARSDAKCRRSDLLITGRPLLSDAALKSLIGEAIVPAMVDSFLAQKGLMPAGRYGNERRLVSDGAPTHDSGEKP